MLFNSWEFISLFTITCVIYFNVPHKFRAFLLLVSSYIFYIFWRWDFALVMLGVTLVNYFCGFKIGESESKTRKKYYLWFALVISLLPLLYLKYGNFFISNFNNVIQTFGAKTYFSAVDVILPVGAFLIKHKPHLYHHLWQLR